MKDFSYGGCRVLSNRENQIIRLVAEGMKNMEIATEMGTTEHVIKTCGSSTTSLACGTG